MTSRITRTFAALGAGLLSLSACSSAEADAEGRGTAGVEADVYIPDCDDNPEEGWEHATVRSGVEIPEGIDLCEIYVEEGAPPMGEEDFVPLDRSHELVVECTDEEALTANESHEPAGWPQDWDGEEPMPDPECHPDFIEVTSWDKYDEFHACWEG